MSSPSRVEKIERFLGELSARPLYIYLPPGYDESDEHYPVIYMHDGQNCFASWIQDSGFGCWRADEVADELILSGKVRPFIIVGVSHGPIRIFEYMPSYSNFPLYMRDSHGDRDFSKRGQAEKVWRYYEKDVAPYVEKTYRVARGRENRAVMGSSMGGLLSAYFGWEHPEFARNIGMLSSAFWLMTPDDELNPMIEKFRTEKPDLRVWLDSGTKSTAEAGDDDMQRTIEARDALLANGWEIGDDFQYYLHEGGIHNEVSWHERLPLVFKFLMK
jgi:predicted alpha/beta superfamily hydrolase